MIFISLLELIGINFDGQQSQTMYKQLIGNDGGILEHKNFVEGHGGDLGNNDPPKGICSGCIDTFELHLHNLVIAFNHINLKLLFELGVVEDCLVFLIGDYFFFLEF